MQDANLPSWILYNSGQNSLFTGTVVFDELFNIYEWNAAFIYMYFSFTICAGEIID